MPNPLGPHGPLILGTTHIYHMNTSRLDECRLAAVLILAGRLLFPNPLPLWCNLSSVAHRVVACF